MHTKLEDWKDGWFGVELGFTSNEIDHLIEQLRMIQKDPDQHFHFSSDYKAGGGIGEILVYSQPQAEISNMGIGSKAYAPGEKIK